MLRTLALLAVLAALPTSNVSAQDIYRARAVLFGVLDAPDDSLSREVHPDNMGYGAIIPDDRLIYTLFSRADVPVLVVTVTSGDEVIVMIDHLIDDTLDHVQAVGRSPQVQVCLNNCDSTHWGEAYRIALQELSARFPYKPEP